MSEKSLIKESEGTEIINLKGGAYQPGLSFREYRFLERTLDTTLPVVNCSTLKAETTIDMHALVHPNPEEEEKKEGKRPFVLGDALHKAVLEPDYLDREDDFFVRCPTSGLDTKSAIETRKANPGKIVIDKDGKVLAEARAMRDAIYRDEKAMYWINQARVESTPYTELTGVCADPEGEFIRKIRVDLCPGLRPEENPGNFLLDLKTVDSSKFMPRRFWTQCRDFGYYTQGAYYLDTDSIIRTGSMDNPREHFIIIAVEKTAPYKVIVYKLKQERIDEGRSTYQLRMAMLAHALRNNEWEGLEYEGAYVEV
tara:strand:- start:7247 stop:8179 length:933 start_codon:yes stop_codon:yes gene_type:complete